MHSLNVFDVQTDRISPLSPFQVLTQWWMYRQCWASTGGSVHHPAPVVNTLRAPAAEASGASGAPASKLSKRSQRALYTEKHVLI